MINIFMSKDAHVQKILAELGLTDEPQLSPEQEEILKTALDPQEQELADILKLFQSEE